MQGQIESVCRQVLEMILPLEDERVKIQTLANQVIDSVISAATMIGSEVEVTIGGSVAKDTWLRKDADIDIFMLFPTTFSKQELRDIGLDVAKIALQNYPSRERYAEHPYLEAFIDNTRVNIVPCYHVERGKWLSAADRTPFHTTYVNEQLQHHDLRDDIRLLKAFMKGIGVYGAEIRVKGFSGYLCELIVLCYQSFLKSLHAASEWRLKELIDMEDWYDGRLNDAKRLFDAPLILVDPVDANRNVAAAVSERRLGEFIMASKYFLKNPRKSFFQPYTHNPPSSLEFNKRLTQLDLDLLFVIFKSIEPIPDILWGQLYKSLRAIKKLLTQYDFKVLKSSAWSNEEEMNILVFSLETLILPCTKLHVGPLIDSKEATSFLEKHVEADSTSIGPWIEKKRWMIGVKRKYSNALVLLRDKLKDGGKEIGIARRFVKEIQGSSQILINNEILDLYSSNKRFQSFLIDFLQQKTKWMS